MLCYLGPAELREKLLQKEKLNLAQLTRIVNSFESIKLQSKAIENTRFGDSSMLTGLISDFFILLMINSYFVNYALIIVKTLIYAVVHIYKFIRCYYVWLQFKIPLRVLTS